MKNQQPLGNPKYSQGIDKVNCDKNVSISCLETDNRILLIKENEETCHEILASSVLLCVKNSQEDCQEEKDYRRANDFKKPYVNIKFYEADCTKKNYQVGNYSVFPNEEQTAEQLKQQLLELINACVNCNCPEPDSYQRVVQTFGGSNLGYENDSASYTTVLAGIRSIKENEKFKVDFVLDASTDGAFFAYRLLIDGNEAWLSTGQNDSKRVFSGYDIFTATEDKDVSFELQIRSDGVEITFCDKALITLDKIN